MKNIYIRINQYGDKAYYKNKKMTILHREDGPAIEWADGFGNCFKREWYINGKLHREDGPAIEYSCGDKYWYLNGEQFTEEEWLKRTSPTLELTLDEIAAKFGVSVDKLKIKK